MKEKEQRSIEWLISQIKEDQLTKAKTPIEWSEIYEQAKELHKKEIMEAFNESRLTHPIIRFKHLKFEDYYTEKYGQ